jgi:hypothetical protein
MSDDPHSKDAIVAHMRHWFLARYEDPNENTPYDGGYVYIYGGPYDAREELEGAFATLIDEDLIAEVAAALEEEFQVHEWSGVPKREDSL